MSRALKHCTLFAAAISLAPCAGGAGGPTEGLPVTPTALQASDAPSDGYPRGGITTGRALLNTLVKRAPAGPQFREAAFDYPVVGADGCTPDGPDSVITLPAGGIASGIKAGMTAPRLPLAAGDSAVYCTNGKNPSGGA